MIKSVIKLVLNHTWKPFLLWYFKKDRTYRYRGMSFSVTSGVFHPGLFFSTKLLVEHVSQLDIADKRFLELGAGSGMISVSAAKAGARVTASDISPTAIETVQTNARQNDVEIETVLSDLFDNLQSRQFDIIIINPPYYPQNPSKESEHAWFCGENFEYFQRLFSQLSDHIAESGIVRMILSEDCEIERIGQIANENGFDLPLVSRKRVLWELNYIFEPQI